MSMNNVACFQSNSTSAHTESFSFAQCAREAKGTNIIIESAIIIVLFLLLCLSILLLIAN